MIQPRGLKEKERLAQGVDEKKKSRVATMTGTDGGTLQIKIGLA